jgi:hypothetical protein
MPPSDFSQRRLVAVASRYLDQVLYTALIISFCGNVVPKTSEVKNTTYTNRLVCYKIKSGSATSTADTVRWQGKSHGI